MKLLKILDDKLEEYFLVALLAAMSILVFVQVIMRYVFENSLSWSEELARYMFLWLIWMGAAYATKQRSHIAIDALKSRLPNAAQSVLSAIVIAIWLAFAVFLTVVGAQLTEMIFARDQLSPAMRIPIGVVYASVPVGCGLMTLRLIENIIKDAVARSAKRKREEGMLQ